MEIKRRVYTIFKIRKRKRRRRRRKRKRRRKRRRRRRRRKRGRRSRKRKRRRRRRRRRKRRRRKRRRRRRQCLFQYGGDIPFLPLVGRIAFCKISFASATPCKTLVSVCSSAVYYIHSFTSQNIIKQKIVAVKPQIS